MKKTIKPIIIHFAPLILSAVVTLSGIYAIVFLFAALLILIKP